MTIQETIDELLMVLENDVYKDKENILRAYFIYSIIKVLESLPKDFNYNLGDNFVWHDKIQEAIEYLKKKRG